MCVTKIKSVPALVLIVGLALDGPKTVKLMAIGQERAQSRAAAEPKRKAADVGKPAQKEQQHAKTDEERLSGSWTIVNEDSKRKGEVWLIGKHQICTDELTKVGESRQYFHRLDTAKSPKQIDITVVSVGGPGGAGRVIGPDVPIDGNAQTIGVIKGIYSFKGDELRFCLAPIDKDRPAKFSEKPKPGEVLVLRRAPEPKANGGGLNCKEKLQKLIDNVLKAHAGEEKLNKLQFTMTVKHGNGYIKQYFVQPPTHFRLDTTHADKSGKSIVILFPKLGRRWWKKEPNENAKEFIPGFDDVEVEVMLDYVKFFGPRQVLRLKDADHKVTLLDEEAKVRDRAAVGVQVKGPHYDHKLYFDKETHLLVKSSGVSFRGGNPGANFREATYSDYKKFDGIPVALKENDGDLKPEVIHFKLVDKFDPKLFEDPNTVYQPKAKEEPSAKTGEAGDGAKFDAVILVKGKEPDPSLLYVVLTQPKADLDKLSELVVKHAEAAIQAATDHKFQGTTKANERPMYRGNIVFLVHGLTKALDGHATGFTVEQLREIAAASPEDGKRLVRRHAWALSAKIPAQE